MHQRDHIHFHDVKASEIQARMDFSNGLKTIWLRVEGEGSTEVTTFFKTPEEFLAFVSQVNETAAKVKEAL